MHRIDGAGATAQNLFTEGDPTQGVPATTVTGAWLNAIQEELANVVEEAGLTLSKPDNTQLHAAILAIIEANQVQAWYTGDVRLTMRAVADAGWVLCNDGTIGPTGSAATARANDDTEALFTLLWNNVADGFAPVSGGRGASAAADWAAGKTIALTRMMGRALAIAGGGSGLSARSLGQYLGAETHTLSAAEMPSHTHGPGTLATDTVAAHTHSFSATTSSDSHTHTLTLEGRAGSSTQATGARWSGDNVTTTSFAATTSSDSHNHTVSGTSGSGGSHSHAVNAGATASSGSGTAHNNMQPTAFLNAMVKL